MSHSQIKLKQIENKKDVKNKLVEEKPPPRTFRDLFYSDLDEYYETASNGRQELAERRHQLQQNLLELEVLLNESNRYGERVIRLSEELNALAAEAKDIPQLIKIAHLARTMRGPGSKYAEQNALKVLMKIGDEDIMPFWVESFRYSRARDSFAVKRRKYALMAMATMALLHQNEQAIDLLIEGLHHKNGETRGNALFAIIDIKQEAELPLPSRLAEFVPDKLLKFHGFW